MISASYLSQFILSTSNGVDPMDQSKLTVGASVSDCLSFCQTCTRLATYPGEGVGLGLGTLPLASCYSWDRLQQTPATQLWIKQVWKIDGWMKNVLLMGVILHTLDKPIKTSSAVVTCFHRQRSPSQVEPSLQIKCPICQHRSTLHKCLFPLCCSLL